jgi:hypothetical protein
MVLTPLGAGSSPVRVYAAGLSKMIGDQTVRSVGRLAPPKSYFTVHQQSVVQL